MVCVGTPSRGNGDLDLTYVRRVCEEIADALRPKQAFTAVVIRSTVLPGTLRNLVIPTLEKGSGKRAGHDFGVGLFPGFSGERRSTTLPSAEGGDRGERSPHPRHARILERGPRRAPDLREFEVAEMVKYADNTWHALKVAFANEIGSISKALGSTAAP